MSFIAQLASYLPNLPQPLSKLIYKQLPFYFTTYLKNLTSIQILCLITVIFLFGFIGRGLYYMFISELRHIPGPKQNLFLPFFLRAFINISKGNGHIRFAEVHKEYGPIVRTAPRFISIDDPEMIRQVYSVLDLPKDIVYQKLKLPGSRINLFNDINEERHRFMRKFLSQSFGIKYIQELAPLMLLVYESLFKKLTELSKSNGDKDGWITINLWKEIHGVSFDIIGETAFGTSFNQVISPTNPICVSIRHMVESQVFSLIAPPILHPVIRKFIPGVLSASEQSKSDDFFLQFTDNVIKARREEGKGKGRKDILEALVTGIAANVGEGPNERLSDEQIKATAILFIVAGSETTGNTLSFALITLLQHPSVLSQLTKEVLSATVSDPVSPCAYPHISAQTTKELPYLNAVVSETLRYLPSAAGGLPRYCDRDITLGGYFIPKGTIVMAAPYAVMRSERNWGEGSTGANVFLPERWLTKDKSETKKNQDELDHMPHKNTEEKHTDATLDSSTRYFPFSMGSRNCLGKHFALQELRLIISNFIRDFEIQDTDPPSKLEEYTRFTLGQKGGIYNVKIRPRQL